MRLEWQHQIGRTIDEQPCDVYAATLKARAKGGQITLWSFRIYLVHTIGSATKWALEAKRNNLWIRAGMFDHLLAAKSGGVMHAVRILREQLACC